jgi:cytochrome c oxidase subunit 2
MTFISRLRDFAISRFVMASSSRNREIAKSRNAVVLIGGIQSVLDAAGPQAGRIERLWWFFLLTTTVVYVVFLIAFGIAMIRGRRQARSNTDVSPVLRVNDHNARRVVAGATGITLVLLFVLLISSITTGRGLASLKTDDALTIKLTGKQWWWHMEYVDPNPSHTVITANEMHVPTGRTVLLRGRSSDVIHSFWAPNVHGKKDLIPGHETTTPFRVDRAGIYRGQCAEYCGLQHAHMSFLVVAEDPADFAKWLARQRSGGVIPHTPEQLRGQKVFLNAPCIMCHTIGGTAARGTVGPDLTHIGGRRTLGAGTISNTREHMAKWILDSGSIKPGNKMPPVVLNESDLQDLVTYLESLQ